jgi:hypothetical protein
MLSETTLFETNLRTVVKKECANLSMQDSPFGDASEPASSNQELKFRLSADSDVKLIFRGDVTQEAVTKLIKLLELSMDTFPTQASLPITTSINRIEEKSSELEVKEVQEISSDYRNA